MRRVALALATGALAASISSAFAASKPAQPSAAQHASFTEDQAWHGRFAFIQSCGECHAGDLGGQFGPALQGPNSNIPWQTPKDVYAYMTAHMPVGNAGGLPSDDYVAIMAFLLQQNGRRAGRDRLNVAAINADPAKMDGSR